jgi:cation diffusion facilitator CzcD-associated flavoprotein CzcO
MKDASDSSGGPSAESMRAKYLEERDKRLVERRAELVDLRTDANSARYRRDPFTEYRNRDALSDDVDVVIVGGGMAGVVTGAELRKRGVGRIRIIDEAGGIGGTWYWNRYPGLMCDIESYVYLPMLEELDYIPKHRYAFGDEIRGHFQAIADKFDLVDDALFHTRVEKTEWDESSLRWRIRTDRGDEITAKYVVMAVGILNLMKLPAIPGMDDFRGKSFHTARWDYEYTGGGIHGNLTGLADKAVAVVGTGASGIQCIPHLAASAKQVFAFQRTPSAIGVRGNRPTEKDFDRDFQPGWQRERMENFQSVLQGHPVDVDLVDDGWTWHFGPVQSFAQDPSWSLEEYAQRAEAFDFEIMEEHRRRIDEIVDDADTAEILKPYYRYICKRPLWHDEFLQTFNAPNVELIDCPAGIERVTEDALVVNGREYAVDCIVYATGFEGEVTPFFRRAGHEIVGRNGVQLAEKWADGPRTLFGTMSRSFPNMFISPCPFQQSVITANFTLATTEVAAHVAATVACLEEKGIAAFDVSEAAEADWCEQILATRVDSSPIMGLCTPSRMNNEGDPAGISPLASNYGAGMGDFFGFKEQLADWRAKGDLAGLELEK